MMLAKKLGCGLERGIELLFGLMVFYLWITSIFFNGITDESEANYINGDRWQLHLLILILFVCFCALCRNRGIRFPSGWTAGLFLVSACAGVLWILMVRTIPCVDQGDVVRIASKLMEHNSEEWLPYGYMDRNPDQRTIVFLYYLLFHVAGKGNYLFIQLLNVPFLLISIFFIGRMIKRVFPEGNRTAVMTGLACCIPFGMYITFVYGTIMGLMFAVAGIDYVLCCMEDFRWKYCLLGSLGILLAVWSKTNYLIFLIAVICMLAADMIKSFQPKKLLLAAVVISVYLAGMMGLDAVLSSMIGMDIPKGVPKEGYVVMGLSDDSYRGPGWYNGYILSKYKELGCDYETSKEYMRREMTELIKKRMEEPEDTLRFFFRKNVTQWGSPAFQCFWIQTICESKIEQPPVVHSVLYGDGGLHRVLSDLFNVMQSLVYAGVCIFLVFHPKLGIGQLIFAIAFIGGFLFHMFWEAKGQYTVVYYFCIIPYAVMGYQSMAGWLDNAYRRYRGRAAGEMEERE